MPPAQINKMGSYKFKQNEVSMYYYEFLQSKQHTTNNFGFKANYIPDIAFDFQRFIIEKAVAKGRVAIFADTGLGKTLMQISIANNIIRETNKRVLILTPLAVAFQFILEAEKLGIDDIEYSKDGKFSKNIVICNYERLHYFDSNDFEAVILDESSILKNFDGKIKAHVTQFMRKIPYRFISTATPSPNDYVELGTSSEALGYLSYMDMLGRFFANNENNIRPQEIGCKWYLKPHAHDDFFRWVNQWSITIKKPSDLGFSNKGYDLPKLHTHINIVENKANLSSNGQIELFVRPAMTMTEVKEEQKQTINQRCEKAVELAKSHDTSVYWVNFNDEAKRLRELDSSASEISGSMKLEEKEELLLAFSNGEIKKLITKAKITSMGLNWQHCTHTVFFPTWSYEQYYQSIRRFWRFGQKNEVICDLVISDGQTRVVNALELKMKKAKDMYENLNAQVNKTYDFKCEKTIIDIKKPSFI